MKIAILSKDTEYAKMLEYELSARGYDAFCSHSNAYSDVVVCDVDTVNTDDKALGNVQIVTFSRNKPALLKRPFSVNVLAEMLSSLEKRNTESVSSPIADMQRRKLYYSGKEASLSPLEARLYLALCKADGNTVSLDEISTLFDSKEGSSLGRTRVLVNSLRTKIKKAFDIEPIESIRGEGYKIKSTYLNKYL